MAKFILGLSDAIDISISKRPVFFSVDFNFPEAVREKLAVEDLRQVEGVFCMAFYCEPHIGDTFDYKGFTWRITGRHFLANRYNKRNEPRSVPKLSVEFVGGTI